MANRVLIGSFAGDQVLRISRPGFDVLDDTLDLNSVAFDSRWSEVGNVVMSGSGLTTQSNGGTNWKTVTFPTPYPAGVVPLVICWFRASTSGGIIYHNLGAAPYATGQSGYIFQTSLFVDETHFQFGPFNQTTVIPFNYFVMDNYYG
ncbi:hypothetical protein NKK48_01610 [Mesorhizobium sp. C386A]|uniref:hypothetical protein n=1 Tax=unclassified Mesorhizobium TaxID=325217 RepID=UPI0003CEC93C|nr:hypothetical protein [Mesorhizobium sp. LNJC386A00]ESY35777.1 hypothetical protein X748_14300 [Mesorhizobium sp. LNJC386A00]